MSGSMGRARDTQANGPHSARDTQANVPHPVLTVQGHSNPKRPNGVAALCAVAHQCHLSPTTQTLPI